LTQSLVPTHSPIKGGEGIAISTFVANPANGYETILTGTAEPLNQGQQHASGIWRGTHLGSTWAWTNPKSETAVGSVRRLLWGGAGFPSRVHAATDTGYWFSDDTGSTWTQANGGCSGTLLLTDIVDYRGLYLLAVGKCSADTQWNLFKKTGAGDWSRIHTLTANATFAWLGMGKTNAYILIGRSDDTGVVEHYNGNTYFVSTTAISQIGGQIYSGYNGSIAVDPDSDSTVYAGAQFLAVNTNSGAGAWTAVGIAHADVHQFAFTRSNNTRMMWIASDAGAHTSTNYSAATPTWSSGFNTFPMSHVTGIDVTRWNGQTVVDVGTWDSLMARGVDDDTGGVSGGWYMGFGTGIPTADCGTVTLDPGTAGLAWATNAFGARTMSTDNFTTVNTSADGSLKAGGELVHDQVPQVYLYTFSPTASGADIYRSTSPGTIPIVWEKLGAAPDDSVGYRFLGVGRYSGGGSYLYLCPQVNQGIWASPPGASTAFTKTSAPTLNYAKIHGWVSSDGNAWKTAYAVANGPALVVRTQDGGVTWKTLTGDLPDVWFQDIVADPINPDIVYLLASGAQGAGLYKTTNGSAASPHWARWVAGLPAGGSFAGTHRYSGGPGTQMQVLDLGASNRWIYAGFWGGSVWKRRTDAHD
jgi:hypothetical protein